MKFMKLGSRPDTFYSSEAIRSISTEVSSDLTIQVKGSRFLLHKFPLLSKCQRLRRLCSESESESAVELPEFPGGAEAFEVCAKFCYGITITVSAHNVVAARCAAEYLMMTEEAEPGNLAAKIDAFLGSCVLAGWRDTLVTLRSTRALPLWSEQLGITARCSDALAAKVLASPGRVPLSHTRACWAHDLADLDLDLYWRTMVAVKSAATLSPPLFAHALHIYAARWLSDSAEGGSKRRLVVESIVSLLPQEKGAVSFSFMLKLVKTGNIVGASKAELVRRAALQLEEATVEDLLIPSTMSKARYDVDVVLDMLEQFRVQGQESPPVSPVSRPNKLGPRRRRSRSAENVNFEFQETRRSASHASRIKVAKLVDAYLQQVAADPNLCLDKFIALAHAVPDFSRVDHDDLYRAIDVYLKAHPEMTKSERKRVCKVLDCKKLSVETCMHAAQNETLPLRVVVQVLFFEQARATRPNELPSNIKAILSLDPPHDPWSTVSGPTEPRLSTLRMKLAEDDDPPIARSSSSSSRLRAFCALPTRPKRMLTKFWSSAHRTTPSQKN